MPKQRSTTRKKRKQYKLSAQKAHERAVKAWRTKHLRYRYGSSLKGAFPARGIRRFASMDDGDDLGIPYNPDSEDRDFSEGGEYEGLTGRDESEVELDLDADTGIDDIDAIEEDDPDRYKADVREGRRRSTRAEVEEKAIRYDQGIIADPKRRKAVKGERYVTHGPITHEELAGASKDIKERIKRLSKESPSTEEQSLVEKGLETAKSQIDASLDPVDQALQALEVPQAESELSDKQRNALKTFASRELAKEVTELTSDYDSSGTRSQDQDTFVLRQALAVAQTHARRRGAEAPLEDQLDEMMQSNRKPMQESREELVNYFERLLNKRGSAEGSSAEIELLLGYAPQATQDVVINRPVNLAPGLPEEMDRSKARSIDEEEYFNRKLGVKKLLTPKERLAEASRRQQARRTLPLDKQDLPGSDKILGAGTPERRAQAENLVRGAVKAGGEVENIGLTYITSPEESIYGLYSWLGDERSGEESVDSAAESFAKKAINKRRLIKDPLTGDEELKESTRDLQATAKKIQTLPSFDSYKAAIDEKLSLQRERQELQDRSEYIVSDGKSGVRGLPIRPTRKRKKRLAAAEYNEAKSALDDRIEEAREKERAAEEELKLETQAEIITSLATKQQGGIPDTVGATLAALGIKDVDLSDRDQVKAALKTAQEKIKSSPDTPAQIARSLSTDYVKELRNRRNLTQEEQDYLDAVDALEESDTAQLDEATALREAARENSVARVVKAPVRYVAAQTREASEQAKLSKNFYERGGVERGLNILDKKGDVKPSSGGRTGDVFIAPAQEKVATTVNWELEDPGISKAEKEKKDYVVITTNRLLQETETDQEGRILEKESIEQAARQVNLGAKVSVSTPKELPDGRIQYKLSLNPDSNRNRITPSEAKAIAYELQNIRGSEDLEVDVERHGPAMKQKQLKLHPLDEQTLNDPNTPELIPGTEPELVDRIKNNKRVGVELGAREKDTGDLVEGEADRFMLRGRLPFAKEDQVFGINLQERTDAIGFGLDYRPGEKELNKLLTAIPRDQQDLAEAYLKYTENKEENKDIFKELAKERLGREADDEEVNKIAEELKIIGAAGAATAGAASRKAVRNKAIRVAIDRLPKGLRDKVDETQLLAKNAYAIPAHRALNQKLYQAAHPLASIRDPGNTGLQLATFRNMTRADVKDLIMPRSIKYRQKFTSDANQVARQGYERAEKVQLLARNLGELRVTLRKVREAQRANKKPKLTVADRYRLLTARNLFDEIDLLDATGESRKLGGSAEVNTGFQDTFEAMQQLEAGRGKYVANPGNVEEQASKGAFTLKRIYDRVAPGGQETLQRNTAGIFGAQGYFGVDEHPAALIDETASLFKEYNKARTPPVRNLVRPVGKAALYTTGAAAVAGTGIYAYDKYKERSQRKEPSRLREKLPETVSIRTPTIKHVGNTTVPTNVVTDALDWAGRDVPTKFRPALDTRKEIRLKNFKDVSGDQAYQSGPLLGNLRVTGPKDARGGSWASSLAFKKPVGGSRFMESAQDVKGRKKLYVKGKETPLFVQVGNKERHKAKYLKTANPGAVNKEEQEKIAVMIGRTAEDSTQRQMMMMQYGDLPVVAEASRDPEYMQRLEEKHGTMYFYPAAGGREKVDFVDRMSMNSAMQKRILREKEREELRQRKAAYEVHQTQGFQEPFQAEDPFDPRR